MLNVSVKHISVISGHQGFIKSKMCLAYNPAQVWLETRPLNSESDTLFTKATVLPSQYVYH